MTAVFSTSSPSCSVAVFDGKALIGARTESAPHGASGASLAMLSDLLKENGRKLEEIDLFVADTGPGSFTGIKVGVMLAKVLAYSGGAGAAGMASFDLVSLDSTVVIASRKGECWVRPPGATPYLSREFPTGGVGYGMGLENPVFPEAGRAGPRLGTVAALAPTHLKAEYLGDPSISVPKSPYRSVAD